MNDAKSDVIVSLFAMVPYLLVTWGYTTFTDGDAKTFWTALGVLYGARLFFFLIEMLGSVLTWHFYRKRIAVRRAVEVLRANNYPMREYQHDDFSSYLARIVDDDKYPESLRNSARDTQRVLELSAELGVFVGMRMNSAMNAALEIHSLRARAK